MDATMRILACLALAMATAQAATQDAAADRVKAGKAIYERCAACHALAHDRTGPRHCSLFGRRAGSIKGFAYSAAMTRSGIVWNAQTLDRFLADPAKAVPGTSMGYAGIADRQERADLIAYLEHANASPECQQQHTKEPGKK